MVELFNVTHSLQMLENLKNEDSLVNAILCY